MTLAERIRALRKAGVKQGDVARRAGVSQPTVSSAANGHDLFYSSAVKITQACEEIEAEISQASV